MTRLAGEQLGLGDQVETLDMELRREGKSYTSDTLAAAPRAVPGGRAVAADGDGHVPHPPDLA